MWIARYLTLSLLIVQTGPSVVPSRTFTYKIPAGSTASLWTGVNVSGKLHVAITSRDGSNKAKMWWIKHPFGRVQQLGEVANQTTIDIPIGLLRAAFGAELKASVVSDTLVFVGENVEVSQKETFEW